MTLAILRSTTCKNPKTANFTRRTTVLHVMIHGLLYWLLWADNWHSQCRILSGNPRVATVSELRFFALSSVVFRDGHRILRRRDAKVGKLQLGWNRHDDRIMTVEQSCAVPYGPVNLLLTLLFVFSSNIWVLHDVRLITGIGTTLVNCAFWCLAGTPFSSSLHEPCLLIVWIGYCWFYPSIVLILGMAMQITLFEFGYAWWSCCAWRY